MSSRVWRDSSQTLRRFWATERWLELISFKTRSLKKYKEAKLVPRTMTAVRNMEKRAKRPRIFTVKCEVRGARREDKPLWFFPLRLRFGPAQRFESRALSDGLFHFDYFYRHARLQLLRPLDDHFFSGAQ